MSQRLILVIDDELETIELIQMAFRRRPYDVVGAMSGPEGLRLARELRPAIILIDVMLPGFSGFEVCRQLRNDPNTATTPLLILSACTSLVNQAEAAAVGADQYVIKPVGIKMLVNLVEGLMAQHCPC
jgi:DNA-binding response OmpR family regulator